MRKRTVILGFLGLLAALLICILWSNSALTRTSCTVKSPDLPESFSGFRIAQVSDLHNAKLGTNGRLLAMLQEADPDIIAITGDLIDSRNTDISAALEFTAEAVKIAPCYYVTGNHEARVAEYTQLRSGLESLGVMILEDQAISLTREKDAITLIGVNDPSFQTDYLFGDDQTVMDTALDSLTQNAAPFTLLLSHRPELLEVYAEQEIDLVLSGHAHGGQFRLPFLGGLFAPNQGFFPEYDSGLYRLDSTQMIVSRGIGNSLFPFRFNNRPELILIELQPTVT